MKSYAVITIRILAFYILANSANTAYSHLYLQQMNFYDGTSVYWLIVGTLIVALSISVALWFSAPKMAARIVAGHNDESISEAGVVSAGSFLIGLYWFIKSIAINISNAQNGHEVHIGAVFLLAVSLLVMLGNKYVSVAYTKLRS